METYTRGSVSKCILHCFHTYVCSVQIQNHYYKFHNITFLKLNTVRSY
jgi:hypothetical protein